MPKKICILALLIMLFALSPCLADALAWAEANSSNGHGGDFILPWELAENDNPGQYILPSTFFAEVDVVAGREDATDADQNDFILASQTDPPSPAIPVSTACIAISPIGNVGTLYLGIPRINGSCQVNQNKISYYLNDATCSTERRCEGNLNSDIECRYPSPRAVDCDNEDATGPCIDNSDLEAMVNVICAPDNAACNECINWETGSPTCTDFRADGYRLKMCMLPDGNTCSWKKCCKRKKKIKACGYPE